MHPLIKIAGFTFPAFSLFLFLAFFACLLWYTFNDNYSKLFYRGFLFRFSGIIYGAAIGGKSLAFIVQRADLKGSFLEKIVNCGFVFYGGLIGGIFGLWIVCRMSSWRNAASGFTGGGTFLYWSDLFASLLPLGQAIGRIGCFFNGCCYGKPWNMFPGIRYPVHEKSGETVWDRVFPTWFVESGFCLCLFILVQKMWGTKHKYVHNSHDCGKVTAVYCVSYSSFRFMLEFFRGDVIRGVYGGISTSQIISLILIIMVVCVYVLRRTAKL